MRAQTWFVRIADKSDIGDRPRLLSELVDAQIAWWQLGFAARRTVLRSARRRVPCPDPDIWALAVAWADQVLAAPRWWRVIRVVGATVLAVVGLAGLANVMAGVSDLVALSGTATVWLPLAGWWTWRQARDARIVVRLDPHRELALVSQSRWLVRAVVLMIAVGSATGGLVYAVKREWSAMGCPAFTIDGAVLDRWERSGGRSGMGCPTGDTRVHSTGVRYTPWHRRGADQLVYVTPGRLLVQMPPAVFTSWIAEGGPRGALGEPTESGRIGASEYMNFIGGTIEMSDGAEPKVRVGQHSVGTRHPDDPCVPHDRPCIILAFTDADGIHLGWQYGAADAFNIAWWPEGSPGAPVVHHEVAGYRFSWPDPRLAASYLVEVQGCIKRFLGRSSCTPTSSRVIIRVG